MASVTQILLLGAGELGSAFVPHLSALPNTRLTIGIRTPSKHASLAGPNISLLAIDTASESPELARTFAAFDIVISATGFGQSAGTVSKLAYDILAAGKLRKEAGKGRLWFFPWQWGVNYDITGDGKGLMPLFGEQKQVRDLLREKAPESNVTWTVVSTGIFMSFLFEQFWGVVDRESGQTTVRALRDWDHKVTVTDVNDIGRVLARVIARDVEAEDRILYVAGDTISYAQLADTVEQITGRKVKREQWTMQYLEAEVERDPSMINKYRLVFARDGVWWEKELTVNYQLGMSLTTVATYCKALLGEPENT